MTAQNRMREIRNDLGVSQQKLADELNVKINPISGIESGKQKEFSLPLAYSIHEKYMYELMWLLYGKGRKFPIKRNTMEPRNISLKKAMKNWGERLTQIQLKSGLSDEQYAKIVEIKYKRFLDLCTKSPCPYMDEVLSICENADVTIDYLLFGDENEENKNGQNGSLADKLGLTSQQIEKLKDELNSNINKKNN